MADWSAYTNWSGKQYSPGDIAYEGVGGGQNSQTQFMRSIQNLLGKTGQETYQTGQRVQQRGEAALDPVLQYFQRLLSGDQGEMAAAVSPESDAIAQQFGAVRRMLSTTQPRGGGRAQVMAQLPFEQAGAIGRLIQGARQQAIGGQSLLGAELMKAGMAGQELGLRGMGVGAQTGLGMRGQDIQEVARNMNFIGGLIGDTASDIMGYGAGRMLGAPGFQSMSQPLKIRGTIKMPAPISGGGYDPGGWSEFF